MKSPSKSRRILSESALGLAAGTLSLPGDAVTLLSRVLWHSALQLAIHSGISSATETGTYSVAYGVPCVRA